MSEVENKSPQRLMVVPNMLSGRNTYFVHDDGMISY
jgi:hypothetical protein